MEHLSLFSRPVVKEIMDVSAGKDTPFVVVYDTDALTFRNYNKLYYKDKIVVKEIENEIIFRDYIGYYGIAEGTSMLMEMFDFTAKPGTNCIGKKFVTNFDKKQTALYEICIEKYNRLCEREVLSINEHATCGFGDLPADSALYRIIEHYDLSNFWNIFDSVKAAAKY